MLFDRSSYIKNTIVLWCDTLQSFSKLKYSTDVLWFKIIFRIPLQIIKEYNNRFNNFQYWNNTNNKVLFDIALYVDNY